MVGHMLALAAATMVFGMSERSRRHRCQASDAQAYSFHVSAYHYRMYIREVQARRDAQIAAQRERDRPWIDAAEAKRQRRREKNRLIVSRGGGI